MASHAPADSPEYAAPTPATDTVIEVRSQSNAFANPDDSPLPSRSISVGPESLAADDLDANDATTTVGRKRKLNSTSARGVANLTPDQLAKKRANDRQAQRAIRERTKSHIETLEQRLHELSSQKPFLDLQAAIQHNERVLSENRELRQGLKAAMDIIQPLLARSEIQDLPACLTQPRSVPPPSYTPPFPEIDLTSSSHTVPHAERSYADSVASLDTPSPSHSVPIIRSRRSSSNGGGLQATSFRNAMDTQRHNIAHGLHFGGEEKLGFNFLLDPSQNVPKVDRLRHSSSEHFRASHPSPPSPLYLQPLNSQSGQGALAFATPIKNAAPTCPVDSVLLDFLHIRQREAAQGIPRQKLVGPPYPSVSSLLNPEKSVDSHPVSKVFTDILRAFPDIASLPEQVAVLYTMFLLMRWQIYPTQENYERLPEWLTPRPTQLLQAHPPWMDYVPWPRMRDRLATSPQDYPFDNWTTPFTSGLSVNWPYEATDCLLSTGDSDELIINPVFERHMRNISNWSLGPLFAENYPGLVDTTTIKPQVQRCGGSHPI